MWRRLAVCLLAPAVWAMAQSPAVSDRDWKRWLEDVKPLMVAAERTQASKVPAPEREQFRDGFWSRRNPTPQAAGNQQRIDFEQRVQTADKRFRNGSNGPWNDCGRAFVLLGQADRVTNTAAAAHSANSDRLAAFRDQDDSEAEQWLYRNPPRLPPAPNGYMFRFTMICESMNGTAFGRLLEQVAASYVVNPQR